MTIGALLPTEKLLGNFANSRNSFQPRTKPHVFPLLANASQKKIEEIVSTSRLRRLDAANADPVERARQLFLGIHGVGLKQSSLWVAHGWRTLEDLKRNNVTLTNSQQIGLGRYDDFIQRIPRAEVECHQDFVKRAASEVSPSLQIIVGGSFRRGAADSGDIDYLVTAPELPRDTLANIIFEDLIPHLFKKDYLQCTLTDGKDSSRSKWLGAARLPGSTTTWRRVDFLIVPWSELGAALLYWTGNDIFNRSMRLLARKKGMRLNQHGLFKDVLRGPNGEKLTKGILIEAHDEQKIFKALGVPYWPPGQRIC